MTKDFSPPERGLVRALRDDRGGAIIVAILVSMVILAMGAVALNMSRSEMRASADHGHSVMVHYHAESGIQRAVRLQNDLTASSRDVLRQTSYSHGAANAAARR